MNTLAVFFTCNIHVQMGENRTKKDYSAAGNRTPVSRVTGGDTNHYTTADITHSLRI